MSETNGIDIGKQLTLAIILAILIYIPAIIIRKKKNVNWIRLSLIYIFLIYISLVLSVTIFRRPEGSREGIVHLFINLGFGFKTGNPSFGISAYSIFNIVLFLPLGFFAYLVIRNKDIFRSIVATTILGLCCSLLIEITQLETGRGMFELTDILTNTTGSLCGTLLAVFIYQVIYKCRYGVQNESTNGQ